jgi:hypothetical protein
MTGEQDNNIPGAQVWPEPVRVTDYTYTTYPWPVVADHRHCKTCGTVVNVGKDYCAFHEGLQ